MRTLLTILVPLAVGTFACSGSESNGNGATPKDGGTGGSGKSDAGTGGTSNAGTGGMPSGGTEAGARCDPGGTWTVIDDFTPDATQSSPDGILVSASGSIFVTGITVKMGVATGLIRKGGNGAAFSELSARAGLGGDLVIAKDGTLFAIGALGPDRVVQRSRDSGKTWESVDSVTLGTGACNTGQLEIDSKDVVYASGSCDAEGWRVSKSTDGGDTWSDVGTVFQLATGQTARMTSLLVDASDSVFTSGIAMDASSVGHWIVRKLQTDGSFSTVDDFQLEAGMGGQNPSLSAGAHLYVSGMADTSAGPHWVIRRANASGAAWTTIDDFTYPNATASPAQAVHEGPSSILVAVGSVTDGGGVSRVVTRRSTDDGKTWTVSDEWTYSPGKSSTGGPIGADGNGNVFGVARGVASDDRVHWIVRRLDCAK